MAINEERSYTEYNVEVPTTDFPIGFDILDDGIDVVVVTLNDVDPATLGYTVIQVNNTTYRFAPAVPSGVVRLTRITDTDQMVHVFTEGAIFISENMDENFKQIRHSQQEVRDSFVKVAKDTDTRLDGFYTDVQVVQAEFLVVEATANSAELSAATALSSATTALNTANAIDAKASTALLNANTALVTANGVDAKATDALDNSLAAGLDATTALNTANGIDAKATAALGSSTTALDTANTALNTANAIDGKASTALDTASTASTLASNALSKTANLSDLNSSTTARNNLGVYSKSEVNTAIASAPIPDATETVAGKAKIATTAIAQAGSNDSDIITPLKLKDTVFGLGQTRKVVTKTSGVTYTNTTGKPIGFEVIFESTSTNFESYHGNAKVNSVIVSEFIHFGNPSYRFSIFVIVLPNETYSFNAVAFSRIERVTEIS